MDAPEPRVVANPTRRSGFLLLVTLNRVEPLSFVVRRWRDGSMILGPDQIVACPFCAGLAKYMTLISGNTFGSHVWTDGKQIAPMLPRTPSRREVPSFA